MAFLEDLKITGSLGNLSFYPMRGVDKIVVRQKGGPSKEYVKNSPTFKVPRLYMSEFGGCSKMGKEVRLMMHPVRTLADYNFSGFINKALKTVQKQDNTGELGRRSIMLSKYPGLLEGFSLNKYTAFDSVIRTPLAYTVSRETLSARVNIPALLRDINFHPNNRHARFRIEMSLGVVPDFTFDAHEGVYKPPVWYTRMFAPKSISSPWYPALKGSPATSLEITLNDQVPADEGYSLMLTVGVRYGSPMEDSEVQEVKRAGTAKVLAIAGQREDGVVEAKLPVEVVRAVAACTYGWSATAYNQVVAVGPQAEAKEAVPVETPVGTENTAEASEKVEIEEVSSSFVGEEDRIGFSATNMKTKRIISKYSNADDSLLREYDIDHISVAELKKILRVGPGDDEVLRVYEIDDNQLMQFAQYVPDLHLQKEELGKVGFFYECFEVG